jgi:hypothetical protein
MDDFNSETDSDYTSYWRDWVGTFTSINAHNLVASPTAARGYTMVVIYSAQYGKFLLAWYVDTTMDTVYT